MQKFKFPMEYLRVTQGEFDTYSHAASMAMDFGGKDTGSDKLYCPCDMIVKRIRENANGEMYLESLDKVQFADGTSDYARLFLCHDSVFNFQTGAVIPQGTYFYDEGGMGGGNAHAFGIHVHIEAGKGKWNSTTQSRNSSGTYVIERQAHLYDLFFIDQNTKVINDGGYSWKVDGGDEQKDITDAVYGLDLSSNNNIAVGSINDKAKFLVLRACVGSSKPDAFLDKFLSGMNKNLKIGFYAANYFGSVQDAIEEADYLVNTIEARGFSPKNVDLPLFCDWEGFSAEYWAKQGITISPALLQQMTEAFCNRIIERGYKAGVYTNLNYWNNMFTVGFFESHPNYYIWYARPGYDKPDRACYMWQYNSNNAAEYGINADLDKDVLMGDFVNERWTECNDTYIVTNSRCEFFYAPDVYATVGKLQEGAIITVFEEMQSDFKWGRFKNDDGAIYYVAILDDRLAPYTEEPKVETPADNQPEPEPELPEKHEQNEKYEIKDSDSWFVKLLKILLRIFSRE